MVSEEFSNALLKTVAFSTACQLVFIFLVFYSLPLVGIPWHLVLPKLEIVMDLWIIENIVFLFGGVAVRYTN